MTNHNSAWLHTYSGRQFWPLKPQKKDVCMTDIAHALSLICRFNGHCNRFYSVAEHSIRVAHLVSELTATQQHRHPDRLLGALLHDSAEAYLCDLPSPIKRTMPEYKIHETAVLASIMARVCLPFGTSFSQRLYEDITGLADRRLLATEARDLLSPPPAEWLPLPPPVSASIYPWPSSVAESVFFTIYRRLRDGDWLAPSDFVAVFKEDLENYSSTSAPAF